jgi:outer membrane receptor protein involved in Fe transport
VDASIGYEMKFGDKPLQLQLSVLNALDKEYLTGVFGPAPTREWKLTARYTF